MPASVAPQLATLADAPPDGDGWIHEIKFDGYRIVAHLRDGRVRLLTRNGHDWTHRFATLATALKGLPVRSAILDGEAVVLDGNGASDFQALQNLLKHREKRRATYFVFDLVHLDGRDLRQVPLIERKGLLRRIIDSDLAAADIQYSDHVRGHGGAALREACGMSLEGIISKRIDAPYTSGRTRDWLKSKCGNRQEFVIIGYTDPQGSRTGFGALLLAYHDDAGKLVYAGRVGTGFDDRLLRELHAQLRKIERDTPPTDEPPPRREQRSAHWVDPTLVAEVRFGGWTRERVLRHPAFIALRSDKPATQIRREEPMAMTKRKKPPAGVEIAGVALTNPDRVLYPEQNLTKLDLARYYEQIADRILPYVADRPLALVRCPQGRGSKCFFQKHLNETLPQTLHGVDVSENGSPELHVYIRDLAGLIQLVQLGVLEIHTWGAPAEDIERPDQITFDLDPAEDVAWRDVVAAARELRELLSGLKLSSFVKTTGGKGLHVVVPLKPSAGWDEVKGFARIVAEHLVAEQPQRYVATMSKAKRTGKIFIDYLRNGRGATAIAPYSTRARAGAPVSMPLDWTDLPRVRSGSAFTVENAPARIRRQKRDPWRDFHRKRVDLKRVMKQMNQDDAES